MKKSPLRLFWIMFLVSGGAFSILGNQPEAEMRSKIENAIRGGKVRDFVSEVLDSKQLDAVKLCFESNHEMAVAVVDLARRLPDGEFRDQVALMALKSASPNTWPAEGLLPYREEYFGEAKLFTALIRKYSPKTEIYVDYLKSRSKRMRLAAEIEQAMATLRPK
jgi:hypothetical protein